MSTVEEKLQKFEDSFTVQINKLQESQNKIAETLDALQAKLSEPEKEPRHSPKIGLGVGIHENQTQHVQHEDASAGMRTAGDPASHSNVSVSQIPVDFQEEYRTISDSVSKIRLRPELKLNDKGNVKQALRNQSTVIKRCARYTETVLKILTRLGDNPESASERDLADIYVCAQAEINYLQDEYANLLAENRYGADTASVFRDLQQNTTVFSSNRVDQLRAAIELQGAHNKAQEARPPAPRRGYSNYRGRGRGYTYSNRGHDLYHNLSSRGLPNSRPYYNNDN